MSDLKKPYEISLWEEEFVYIITETGSVDDRYETNTLPKDKSYTILNQYVKENKVATIGSNVMESPIKVFDPKFTQQTNGTNTLTFQLYYRYYDEDIDEFKLNPFFSLLVNERKIKLYYNDEWFDLVIKDVQEKSEGNVFSYTCKDQYINELSKNGYSLNFDNNSENNLGSVTELAEKILDGTEWLVGESDLIQQTNKEALYICNLPIEVRATCMNDFEYKREKYNAGDEILISPGQQIYIFYSSFKNKENPIQFLYNPTNQYITDDGGFILNSPNWKANINISNFFEQKLSISTNYFGEKLIANPVIKYIPEIDKYCNIYNNSGMKYYGYTETEYSSITEVQNILTNNINFISTNGWTGIDVNGAAASTVTLSNLSLNDVTYRTIEANFGTAGAIKNSGIYDNRKSTNGFVAGESYIFAIRVGHDNSNNGSIRGASIKGYNLEDTPNILETFFVSTLLTEQIVGLENYQIYKLVCQKSLSYNNLLKYDLDFYIEGTGILQIIDGKLFKERRDANGKLIVPDLQQSINSIIRSKIYLFPASLIDEVYPSKIFNTNDITFSAKLYQDELITNGFILIYSDNFEKRRNITGSKSNRFNLLQEVAETFECWARFYIIHDNLGRVVYEYENIGDNAKYIEGKTYYTKIEDSKVSKSKDFHFRIAKKEEINSYTLVNKNESVNTLITYYKKTEDDYEELLFDEGNFININADLLTKPIWAFKPNMDYYIRIGFDGKSSKYFIKNYNKFVTFKKYIGRENYVGFRYGINLKSIQRTINSDQIVTKLIVEPNTNQYAPNGFCSIQNAELNPTGETTIYNFEYYLRQNLLDKDCLYTDLYDDNNGLGLYVKYHDWNAKVAPLIEELVFQERELDKLFSDLTLATTALSESKEQYEEAVNEIKNSEGISYESAEILTKDEAQKSYSLTYIIKRDSAKTAIATAQTKLNNTKELYNKCNEKLSAIDHELYQIELKKHTLETEFYKKYSRFIQEGTWSSNDYINPEDYFLDGQMVSFTSAFPKITYTINVIEISQIEGYKPYYFQIGDKTYIEDTEFFGWNENGRPYQEEIIVNEVSYNLDDPSKNTIKVQNFKTQFEDLFQRIAATSQSLQYYEGEYRRAASAINADGSINSSFLQNSLKNNNLVLQNAREQSVYWDETGITISSAAAANEIVRLVSGGIMLSVDGGRTWATGITGAGINANMITTGQLDTSLIRVFSSDSPTFTWNSSGISAFSINEDNSVNYNQYVRFNQYGLYGWISEDNFDPKNIEQVIENANFSLTWKGLKINLPNTGEDNEVININDKFIVKGDGSIHATNGYFSGIIDGKTTPVIIQGEVTFDANATIIGAGIKVGGPNLDNFVVDSDGNVSIKGEISIEGAINFGSGQIGVVDVYVTGVMSKGLGIATGQTSISIADGGASLICGTSRILVSSAGIVFNDNGELSSIAGITETLNNLKDKVNSISNTITSNAGSTALVCGNSSITVFNSMGIQFNDRGNITTVASIMSEIDDLKNRVTALE